MVIFGIFVWLWIATALIAVVGLCCALKISRNVAIYNLMHHKLPMLAMVNSGFMQSLWLRDITTSRGSPFDWDEQFVDLLALPIGLPAGSSTEITG